MKPKPSILSSIASFLQRHARWIGVIISLIAMGAFIKTFLDIVSARELEVMYNRQWAKVPLALSLYCLAYVPMVLGWIVLAKHCGAQVANSQLVRIFLISQIGKYFPGNIGHLLGRAYLARARGIPLPVCGTAMSLEVIGVLAAGAIVAGIAGISAARTSNYFLVPMGAAALASVLLVILLSLLSRRRSSSLRGVARPLTLAIVCYSGVFGLLVAAHGILLGMDSWPVILQVAGAVVVSWLAGFMVPGAPAGLGLRELSLYALLAGLFPKEAVLFAATGMRLATTAGDGIAWLVGLGVARRAAPRTALAS